MIINNKDYGIRFLISSLIVERRINTLTSSALAKIYWQANEDLEYINKGKYDIHNKK